eukprot:m.97849 g.97849  ORF g.97849 m.97849 type:complete len:707 (+) comp13613_c0_seq2:215-2335(+)
MSKSKAEQNTLSLAELQNLIKRDPGGYKEEFQQQYVRFESDLQIFNLRPSEEAKDFGELVSFVAAVSQCYPSDTIGFVDKIKSLLEKHCLILDPALRQTLCRALILMRNRDLLSPTDLLELFFKLFRCPDKLLRITLYKHITGDIKRINQKHKQNQINKKLQNFMYEMLQDKHVIAAKKSLDIMIELYRKRIWADARTVNVLATVLTSEHSKLKVCALKFFLGSDDLEEDDDEDEQEDGKSYQDMLRNTTAKKSNKRKRLLKRQLAKEKKRDEKKDKAPIITSFSALHLLQDPQTTAEKLFKQLKSSKERWEVQLMQMNLISRVIATHELVVLNFYPFMEKFLWPHKQDVTQVLAYVSQACHPTVPPDTVTPVILKIAHNFVSEKSAPAVMAVGINAIREICVRCPLAMSEDLLSDLVEYKKFKKDKGVAVAARGLIATFRELNPKLLHKRDRGKPGEKDDLDENAIMEEFGQSRPMQFVPGAELLSLYQDSVQQKDGKGTTVDPSNEGENEDNDETENIVDDGESADEGEDDGDEVTEDLEEEEETNSPKEDGETVIDKLTAEERRDKAIALTNTRPLTQEDFDKIKEMQLEKKVLPAAGLKRSRLMEEVRESQLDPDDILPIMKKQRQTKEERLASIHEGREDRGKFTARKGHNGGTTNKMKEKQKNMPMIRQKVIKRRRQSLSQTRGQKRAQKKRHKGKFRKY